MKATPITPGKFYRVTGQGIDITVHCSNPVDAVLHGLCCAMAAGSLA